MGEIIIRNVKIEDGDEIQKIYSYYVENSVSSFEIEVPSSKEIKNRIKNILENGYPYIIAEDESKNVIGYAYANKFGTREAYKYSSELSIYVSSDIHRKGIGQKLYDELEKKLKAINIIHIVSVIVDSNTQSIKFHLKNGFETIGHFENCGYKFDMFNGIIWMRKQINDLEVVKNDKISCN